MAVVAVKVDTWEVVKVPLLTGRERPLLVKMQLLLRAAARPPPGAASRPLPAAPLLLMVVASPSVIVLLLSADAREVLLRFMLPAWVLAPLFGSVARGTGCSQHADMGPTFPNSRVAACWLIAWSAAGHDEGRCSACSTLRSRNVVARYTREAHFQSNLYEVLHTWGFVRLVLGACMRKSSLPRQLRSSSSFSILHATFMKVTYPPLHKMPCYCTTFAKSDWVNPSPAPRST